MRLGEEKEERNHVAKYNGLPITQGGHNKHILCILLMNSQNENVCLQRQNLTLLLQHSLYTLLLLMLSVLRPRARERLRSVVMVCLSVCLSVREEIFKGDMQ